MSKAHSREEVAEARACEGSTEANYQHPSAASAMLIAVALVQIGRVPVEVVRAQQTMQTTL